VWQINPISFYCAHISSTTLSLCTRRKSSRVQKLRSGLRII